MATIVSGQQMTYEEFLRAYDGQHAEWVNGEVIPMSPVGPRNQQIANFLVSLLQHHCEAKQAGVVLSAPVQMKTGEIAREPDVMVLLPAHADLIKPRSHVAGPADLVVEIISPDSRGRDRGEKFYEYEQAGIPEYWLIDPDREQAEFYHRNERGIYELLPVREGRFESRVLPGVWLEVAWLWQEPLPPLLGVLKQWGLV